MGVLSRLCEFRSSKIQKVLKISILSLKKTRGTKNQANAQKLEQGSTLERMKNSMREFIGKPQVKKPE